MKRKFAPLLVKSITPNKRPAQNIVKPFVIAEGIGQIFDSPNAGVSIKANKVAVGKSELAVFALNLTICSYRKDFKIEASIENTPSNEKSPVK